MTPPVPRIAALPMYDFPWTAEANDALWRSVAQRLAHAGVVAPAALTRSSDLQALWRDPGLLLGQTCGYPYATALKGDVDLIAAPVYGFRGCEGATHRSFIIVAKANARRDLADFRGARAAINSRDSNTGVNLFRAAIAPLAGGRPFFREIVVTGAHAASLAAVASGAADLAAIDCVSFALLARGRPRGVAEVAIIAETAASPSLPFIASAGLPAETRALVRDALFAAIADPSLAQVRETIGLRELRGVAPDDYEPVMAMERQAAFAGYPTLV